MIRFLVFILFCSLSFGQVPLNSNGLLISLLARIEKLENRVRFLEEQLMRKSTMPSLVQKPSKSLEKGFVQKKEPIIERKKKVISRDVYQSFFVSNVARDSWRLKKISCKEDIENKKVDCEAEFRISGKVGRQARKNIRGVVLLGDNLEPLRVFSY
ncbi:hypothetical protein MJH12_00885 [bacterium]|nr:hypothetical protein [bacterium]